jgi:hypothetical protein
LVVPVTVAVKVWFPDCGRVAEVGDFSYYVKEGVPGFYFSLGGADPEKFAQAKASGTNLPSNHSPLFAPDLDPTLHTGIAAEVAVLRNLLKSSPEELKKLTSTLQP